MCSWVIPPRYDPYSIPSILAAEGFTVCLQVTILVKFDFLRISIPDARRGLRDSDGAHHQRLPIQKVNKPLLQLAVYVYYR